MYYIFFVLMDSQQDVCSLWDNVATSFLNIDSSGVWSVIIYTSLDKQHSIEFL